MRAYHRVDPLMDERKSHYSPAQLGAFLKVQLLAGRQSNRGRFRSIKALEGALPAAFSRHIPFLVAEGDLVTLEDGSVYVDGWDEWQEGDITVAERMARLRARKAASSRNTHRNGGVTPTVTPTVTAPSHAPSPDRIEHPAPAVTQPSPTAIGVGVSVSVRDRAPTADGVSRAERSRGPSDDGRTTGPLLSAGQIVAWQGFGPEWDGFREAWMDRGFRLPPTGSDTDGDGGQTQRRLLWTVVKDWPRSVGEWVREAPPRATTRQVIDHVLERYHAELARRAAEVDDLDFGGEAA